MRKKLKDETAKLTRLFAPKHEFACRWVYIVQLWFTAPRQNYIHPLPSKLVFRPGSHDNNEVASFDIFTMVTAVIPSLNFQLDYSCMFSNEEKKTSRRYRLWGFSVQIALYSTHKIVTLKF